MQKTYFDKVHTWGILWNIGALITLLGAPVIICLDLGVGPDFDAMKAVTPKLMALYWLTAIVEVITYVPLLGAGGTYLSFVTGNISNLKLPVGLKAMENAGAGIVIEENVLNEDLLYGKIKEVISNEELLQEMGDNAAKLYKPNVEQEIYNEIKSVVK